jgi:hypothetical protein
MVKSRRIGVFRGRAEDVVVADQQVLIVVGSRCPRGVLGLVGGLPLGRVLLDVRRRVFPEGRDLDHLVSAAEDVREAEAAADDAAVAEEPAHLVGLRALVATSKSFGALSRSRSRTQPPTR